jgi:hypothetical protein
LYFFHVFGFYFTANAWRLNFQVHQIVKDPKYLEQPDYDNNHDNRIKNGFNRSLHGNVSVHEPENNSGHYKDDDDGKDWHNISF